VKGKEIQVIVKKEKKFNQASAIIDSFTYQSDAWQESCVQCESKSSCKK